MRCVYCASTSIHARPNTQLYQCNDCGYLMTYASLIGQGLNSVVKGTQQAQVSPSRIKTAPMGVPPLGYYPNVGSPTALPWEMLALPDPEEAMHVSGTSYKCWTNHDWRQDGCPDAFPYGTKHCPNCGRIQKYPVLKQPVSEDKCTVCWRELSSWIDAYYGRDPAEAKKCTRCRK